MDNDNLKILRELVKDLHDISDSVHKIMKEEVSNYNNMPEDLKESDEGESLDYATSLLDSAVNDLSSAIVNIEQAL